MGFQTVNEPAPELGDLVARTAPFRGPIKVMGVVYKMIALRDDSQIYIQWADGTRGGISIMEFGFDHKWMA